MRRETVKVLYFVDRMLRGGIQSLVIDWVSRFDKNKIHVDFLLLDDGNEYELEEELKKIGCNVYKLKSIWIRKPQDFIKEAKALDNFFKKHNDYKVVHLHSSSKNYMVLKYAKKYGIPIRIAHSHNIGFQTKKREQIIIGNFLKILLRKYSTDYFACSKIAGEWMFGKNIAESNKFKIINNAINFEKFKYNKKNRIEIRERLKITDDDIIIGNIGRFSKQKNHTFLIDIFNEIHKSNKKYKLLLVGTGENEQYIKDKVNKLGLTEFVIFLGFRNDIHKVIQAMDLFLFPSLYEGLGLVLIEAQATGIPCFTTKDTVPLEVKISNNLSFIELKNNPEVWAKRILECNLKRKNAKKEIKEAGYFIDDIVEKLSTFYLE